MGYGLKNVGIKWRYIEKTMSCWNWLGTVNNFGYGSICINGKRMTAHKYIYEKIVGEVPEKLQLDHLCRNKKCVNPAHLEVVTARINTARSESPSAKNMQKTHCINGHPLIGENVYRDPKRPRWRYCRECRRKQHREYMRRKGLSIKKYKYGLESIK